MRRLFSLDHSAVAVLEVPRCEAVLADVVVDRSARAFNEGEDERLFSAGHINALTLMPRVGLWKAELIL